LGMVATCLSTRRCSSMRHIPYYVYTLYGMSTRLGIAADVEVEGRAAFRRAPWNSGLAGSCEFFAKE
jgi:hypothetical protein